MLGDGGSLGASQDQNARRDGAVMRGVSRPGSSAKLPSTGLLLGAASQGITDRELRAVVGIPRTQNRGQEA